ncbi:MAG: GNAT family N-acetyltransferase [Candidatus Krumholzibacteria bacterium]|nr:GNAT family N-acetyltransferase [Candidatus Krumholzibacteria bacterium]
MPSSARTGPFTYHQLTIDRWEDFERLFGERGACGGCWCMWWRVQAKEFEKNKGSGNRRAMKRIVDSGTVPGILAYSGGEPVGWCSVAPRGDFPRLERSRILAPVDDRPVWSIVCLFVAKGWRRRGVSAGLVGAAVKYARSMGGTIAEAYPVDPGDTPMPDTFAFHGLASTFVKAGFAEAARRSKTRPVMSKTLKRERQKR